jgi:hypothetical protein
MFFFTYVSEELNDLAAGQIIKAQLDKLVLQGIVYSADVIAY